MMINPIGIFFSVFCLKRLQLSACNFHSEYKTGVSPELITNGMATIMDLLAKGKMPSDLNKKEAHLLIEAIAPDTNIYPFVEAHITLCYVSILERLLGIEKCPSEGFIEFSKNMILEAINQYLSYFYADEIIKADLDYSIVDSHDFFNMESAFLIEASVKIENASDAEKKLQIIHEAGDLITDLQSFLKKTAN